MRTLAYDLPGHARSASHPAAGSARKSALAILSDLQSRGIAGAHLVGHSMGGAMATLMAAADPERFASLTLLAPGGFGEEINARLLRRLAAASTPADIAACMEMMFGWSRPMPDEATLRIAAGLAWPGHRESMSAIGETLERGGKQGVIPAAELDRLRMPVSVLWGEQDCVLPARQAAGLPPRFNVRVLPRIGHMLPEEAPAEVAAIIRAAIH